MLDDTFASLRHPAVRDLAWLLGAPALLAPEHYPIWTDQQSGDLYSSALPLLQTLEHDPAPLLAHLALRPVKRLGYYVENLLGFAFSRLPGWQVIAEHWPIRDQARTVGELDFLLQEPGHTGLLHLECAFKIYLLHQPQAGIYGFYGPTARDRLHLKLDKLFRQQLPLSQREDIASQLTLPIGSRLGWLKGWLFYPWGQPRVPIAGLSPHHPSGWWQTQGSVQARLQVSGGYWLVLPRPRWIAPAWLAADSHVLNGVEMAQWLNQHFAGNNTPQMLLELAPVANGYMEQSRGIIVGDDWPAAAS